MVLGSVALAHWGLAHREGLEPSSHGFGGRHPAVGPPIRENWGEGGNRTLVTRFTAGYSATELPTPLTWRGRQDFHLCARVCNPLPARPHPRKLAEAVGVEPTQRFTSHSLGFQDRGLTNRPRFQNLAEGQGIEPRRPSLTGYALARRPIASLATFLNSAWNVHPPSGKRRHRQLTTSYAPGYRDMHPEPPRPALCTRPLHALALPARGQGTDPDPHGHGQDDDGADHGQCTFPGSSAASAWGTSTSTMGVVWNTMLPSANDST